LQEAEREKRRMAREFEGLRGKLAEKEMGVKGEIERVWGEWEDRCNELEQAKLHAEFKLEESD
jgi:hypothetical protein